MPSPPDIHALFLVTGPSAVGKSTVAAELARRFERGVHLEGDVFRRSVVAGRHEPTPTASVEALDQLRLRYRAAAAAADVYFSAGFAVVVEDVVAGKMLGEYVEMIRGPTAPRRCPHRKARRPGSSRRRALDDGVRHLVDRRARCALRGADAATLGLWLDSSDRTPAQTVDEILASLVTARVD